MILLFEVTLTLTAPTRFPLTTTTAFPSAWTAAVKAAKLDTVVVVPPAPPVVLQYPISNPKKNVYSLSDVIAQVFGCYSQNLPSVQGTVPNRTSIRYGSSLLYRPSVQGPILRRRGHGTDESGQEGRRNTGELHI